MVLFQVRRCKDAVRLCGLAVRCGVKAWREGEAEWCGSAARTSCAPIRWCRLGCRVKGAFGGSCGVAVWRECEAVRFGGAVRWCVHQLRRFDGGGGVVEWCAARHRELEGSARRSQRVADLKCPCLIGNLIGKRPCLIGTCPCYIEELEGGARSAQ